MHDGNIIKWYNDIKEESDKRKNAYKYKKVGMREKWVTNPLWRILVHDVHVFALKGFERCLHRFDQIFMVVIFFLNERWIQHQTKNLL